jgi:4-diphosphocytidyl-2-C-methyl-D-erythritol kinase
VPSLRLFAPAKINLFLAVTGRRPDGFHELVSLVAPLAFGDELLAGSRPEGGDFRLTCDSVGEVPLDQSNLILKAAAAFRAASGLGLAADFHLIKRIPVGAGLGGGSSDAAAALLALNALAGEALSPERLGEVAAGVGSDCPLFLHRQACLMRGRGEQIEPLPASAAQRLRGQRLLVFKPSFGISTPWAYRRLAELAPASYLPEADAEDRLAKWISKPDAPLGELLLNGLEQAAFSKFVALPTLLEKLCRDFGVACAMSGSGSACFALLRESDSVVALTRCIRDAFGEDAFVIETQFR